MNEYVKIDNYLRFDRDVEFPQLKGAVYVDHAGSTLYSKTQIEAQHKDLLSNLYGNPHSRSQSSSLATDIIDQIRYRVLQHFNCTTEEYCVIFTSGCTAALKIVAESFTFDDDINYDKDATNHKRSVGVDEIHDQQRFGSGQNTGTIKRRGCFAYLQDNHTSVYGMREVVKDKVENIICVDDLAENSFERHFLLENRDPSKNGNSLFVFPAQSNYSGKKYNLNWIKQVHQSKMTFQESLPGRWFVLLDAAGFVSTSHLDLSVHKPDFISLSFYKIFGFPTGIGALLVRNEATSYLNKSYFGGGTVAVSSPTEMFNVNHTNISQRFEDGTAPFLDIIALRHGFDALESLGGGIKAISHYTFSLAQYFHHCLKGLHHDNGQHVAEIYCHDDFTDQSTQGPIVNFNLKRGDGGYIGFAEVDKMAQLYNIHLRTGCFCNIGACQKFLHLTSDQVKENFEAGHVCGDDRDLINGKPTGSIRISFGYMSTISDVQHCIRFIYECFVERGQKLEFSCEKFLDQNLPSVFSSHLKKQQDFIKDDMSLETSQSLYVSSEGKSKDYYDKSKKTTHDGKTDFLKHLSDKEYSQEVKQLDDYDWSFYKSDTVQKLLLRCSLHDMILTNICLYPVKSCGAFEVTEWEICDTGLLYDREWMIVSESGVTISQKREPKLCLIKPKIDLNKKTLTLTFPDMCSITVPINRTSGVHGDVTTLPCVGKVCGDKILGRDCGESVGRWISEALQRPGCRLIQKCDTDRKCKLQGSGESASSKLSLTNESQYLLISRQSVQQLQVKIHENSQNKLDLRNLLERFRANIVVGGGHAFEEDNWKSLNIGKSQFVSQGGCSRCQMVCLDQMTGERSKEPLKTLASWRGKRIPFGIYLLHDRCAVGNILKVGDMVVPLKD